MKKTTLEAVVFVILVSLAFTMRLMFRDVPNFHPVAAVGLFGGFFFRSIWLAVLAPVVTMIACDFVIGGYEAPVMVAVYGSLTLPVLMRSYLKQSPGFPRVISCSLAMSCFFFLTTNFAVWMVWESGRFELLLPCYGRAVPFFRYTLIGDLLFSGVFFGAFALVSNWVVSRRLSLCLCLPS